MKSWAAFQIQCSYSLVQLFIEYCEDHKRIKRPDPVLKKEGRGEEAKDSGHQQRSQVTCLNTSEIRFPSLSGEGIGSKLLSKNQAGSKLGYQACLSSRAPGKPADPKQLSQREQSCKEEPWALLE